MQWNSDVKPCSGSTLTVAEGLQGEVKKVGGYLQLLIQGCDSDISSMVTEALKKSNQSIKRTVQLIGQLALVTGTELHTAEHRSEGARTYKNCFAVPLYEGACKGLTSLLDDGLHQAKEMQREVQVTFPQSDLLQELKKNISVLATSIQNYIMHCKQRSIGSLEGHEDGHSEHLKTVKTIAVEFIKFIESIRQIQPIVISALRGQGNSFSLRTCTDGICSSAKSIEECISSIGSFPSTAVHNSTTRLQIPCMKSSSARNDLESAVNSLTAAYDQVQGEKKDLSNTQDNMGKAEGSFRGNNSSLLSNTWRKEGIHRTEYTYTPHTNLACFSPSGIQWV